MQYLEIILPLALLVLAFIMKLSINREIAVPNLIQAICELPVDIIFLTISFLVGFTIAKADNPSEGLFYTISFIAVATLVLSIWRYSLKLFEKGKKTWVLLLLTNLAISSLSLYMGTNILLKNRKNNSDITTQHIHGN